MAAYNYLDEAVRGRVKQAVKTALAEVGKFEPPVSFDDLFEHERIQASAFRPDHPNFRQLLDQIGAKAADSVRGCLFVPDKLVVVRDDGYQKRTNFVLAHEFGHWKLPWHQAVLYECSEFDLSAGARTQMEREANFFASEISFMGDIFTERLRASPLSHAHLSKLADQFEMSLEATIRRAVELEERPCVFVAMNVNENSEDEFLSIKYLVHSAAFERQYGAMNHRQSFSRNHVFARAVLHPGILHSGEVRRTSDNLRFSVEGWKNSYNAFALCMVKV